MESEPGELMIPDDSSGDALLDVLAEVAAMVDVPSEKRDLSKAGRGDRRQQTIQTGDAA